MLYRDLIQFDPIESIIQLREAGDRQEAAHLVQTYVISQRMADQLANLVIPTLQIDRPADNKGLLIVGNYGTGKSHLLSVLSAVAEHAELAESLRHPAVRQAAAAIAGRFKVWRIEIGGVEKNLRDIILDELAACLAEAGTPFHFPAADQVTNNKDALLAALAAFSQLYPDQGLLLVVDELLDYLRTRQQRELILDLGFLRELGEIVPLAPFRFLAGVQETLFDNPRFSFVAEQLRRVRDRFEQARIAREDIAFVVSERLLRKSDAQIAAITEHLRRFTRLYPPMADRLAEYARLFPIHPAYIETFERVYVAEKREVLKTYSQAMRRLLDAEVPADQPGLISYDHYWDVLRDNASLRTLPGIADVVEKSAVLEGRIRNAYTRPQLQPMALRIVQALSVHRLTSELERPLGVTAAELRDQLCLWTPMPESEADFLAGLVEVALREIMRTVSGQYISFNEDNGQYYLDLKKDIDFDARIAERGAMMDLADLNLYFFNAVQSLLNLPNSVYVPNFPIWLYELPWAEHRVTRPGYLFFGAANERSTAQPPRDFYVYILAPFAGRGAAAPPPDLQVDEVTFSFHGLDAAFAEIVRGYAGARALANESPNHRQVYEDKAETHGRKLRNWLKANFNDRVRVSYRGVSYAIPEALAQTRSSASQDLEDLLRVLASHFLALHFGDRYPSYPRFTRLPQAITESSRAPSALEAVRSIARGTRTNLATAVLDGLQLLDESGALKPLNSPYARHFLQKLHAKGENQVVNHGEVLALIAGGVERPIYKDLHFGLEPEWVAVILAALTYDGQTTLNLGGSETLDAGNIIRAAAMALEDLTNFRFFARPRALPLPLWTQIFEGLGLQTALLRDENQRSQAVAGMQAQVRAELGDLAAWEHAVQNGMRLWNESLFTDRISFGARDGFVESHSDLPAESLGQADVLPALRQTKTFLETLTRFDTPGKLRNLSLTEIQVDGFLAHRRAAQRLAAVLALINRLAQPTAYLSEAAAMLPHDHPWSVQAAAARGELLAALRRQVREQGSFDLPAWLRRLDALRQQYVQVYSDLHRRYVLGPADDERRARLQRGPAAEGMQALAQIDILNRAEFERWGEALAGIRTCREFHEGLLADAPRCPRCNFQPSADAGQLEAGERLDQLAGRLDAMLAQWHAALRQNLTSDVSQESISHMAAAERQALDAYLALTDPAAVALPSGLAAAANTALRGIDMVSLSADALLEALQTGGLPCTMDELAQRFSAHLQRAMTGHDRRTTRLTIER